MRNRVYVVSSGNEVVGQVEIAGGSKLINAEGYPSIDNSKIATTNNTNQDIVEATGNWGQTQKQYAFNTYIKESDAVAYFTYPTGSGCFPFGHGTSHLV